MNMWSINIAINIAIVTRKHHTLCLQAAYDAACKQARA